mmetsp:Transcript_19687/g.28971  ORF Transcript_19687/g.28971 Transcript_19687/m.28971 type:complete len:337 (-) Transcript_19687:176-1186(-)|eukprot:CAMPEP_0195518064 /NCGR_PEP_ID=MMETSP0794_2-20130614/12106_1 /TAXON_ID=515487 /ORGANISM="Stephanopyxis turris, Strain CCMP 815" /LENGTH=336 /DNA_ID=CAMNT_0040646971 /DNA_START=206 /DNA_END=1216 /DNA_ORIENTATION=+
MKAYQKLAIFAVVGFSLLNYLVSLFTELPIFGEKWMPVPYSENQTNLASVKNIPLHILVESGKNYECAKGLNAAKDTILLKPIKTKSNEIPPIVHMTSKSRCLTESFLEAVDLWRFKDHSLYFHDDDAVSKIFNREWPEFPHLQLVMKCMVSGAAKADLWRYLVLWEYGGIYTDIDNKPGEKIFNGTAIQGNDAYLLVESGGFPSQYFIAASPKHPLMYLAVHQTLHRLMSVDSVLKQYVPFVTGPGALKSAFIAFTRNKSDGYPTAGNYDGLGDRNVTIAASRGTGRQYVCRDCVEGKQDGYNQMNMSHFSKYGRENRQQVDLDKSCFEVLFNKR